MGDIATGIIERYRRYGRSEPGGEWGFLYNTAWTEFHELLEAGDAEALDRALSSRFFTLCGGIASQVVPDQPTVRRMIGIWGAMTADFPSPNCGSYSIDPLSPAMDGKVVATMDTPRHDHYAVQILRYLSPGDVLLEIGGGYGGTTLQLLSRSVGIQVVLCDLPETLYLAWFYLTATSDRPVSWWDDKPMADVVLVPDFELGSWDGRPRMVFSAHSLSEMPAEVVADYLAWISRAGVQYFYTDNAAFVGTGPGSLLCESFPEVLMSDLVPPGPYVERWRRQIPWDTEVTRYMEAFYERVE